MIYDLVIIGGGPAGVAAGVYAARKKIKTILITDTFGGQSLVSADIRNWIGEVSISGFELAQKLENHLRSYPEVEIVVDDLVEKIEKSEQSGDHFIVSTKKGKKVKTRTIILVTGSSRKKLGVPGEKDYEGKGVFYCATCDAPLLIGKKAAVIGGGNSALETVIDLMPYASFIYLLVRGDSLKGDAITQEKIKSNSQQVEILWESEVQEFFGDGKFLKGLKYLDKKRNELKVIEVDGAFVEIGNTPNSYLVKDLVELNERGEIVVDHKTQMTSVPGIWAAGDVTDALYKQNNISVGDAIKAVLNVYDYLLKTEKVIKSDREV